MPSLRKGVSNFGKQLKEPFSRYRHSRSPSPAPAAKENDGVPNATAAAVTAASAEAPLAGTSADKLSAATAPNNISTAAQPTSAVTVTTTTALAGATTPGEPSAQTCGNRANEAPPPVSVSATLVPPPLVCAPTTSTEPLTPTGARSASTAPTTAKSLTSTGSLLPGGALTTAEPFTLIDGRSAHCAPTLTGPLTPTSGQPAPGAPISTGPLTPTSGGQSAPGAPTSAGPPSPAGQTSAGGATAPSPAPMPAAGQAPRSLWSAAHEKLPPPDKESLLQLCPAASASAAGTPPGVDIAALSVLVAKRRDECQNGRWRFSFRGRDVILRDKAAKVLAWLDKFKQVGDVAVNYDPQHAALPWAGVRFLLEAAVAEEKQMGALLVGVERVAHITSRCHTYEALYRQELPGEAALTNLEASLVELYKVVLTFLSCALKLFRNSGTRRAMHAVWNPGEMEDFVTELEKHEGSVERDASNCESVFQRAAHGEHTKQLQSLLASLCAPLLRIDSGVEALLDRSDQRERVEALRWASRIPYESNHIAAREGRTANTAEWILQHPTYRDWRSSSASTILWLHGIPGAGKTKVVSRVVDDISEQLKSKPNNEGFAYFYFNRNDASRQNPSAALCSLVRQLALSADGEAVQHALMQLYRENHKRAFAAERLHDGDAEQLLRQFVDMYPQTTLVLDALDECDAPTRTPFVDMLENLTSTAAKPVKFFISSRLDRDIAERFEAGPNVAITATDNADDIARYVEAELAKRPQWTRKLSDALLKEIVRTLCEKSRGMFQWAVLQLGQLFSRKREIDVRSRLGKLPDDLGEAYDELYAAICNKPDSAPVIAKRAFMWVMCSFRPLSSKKLVAAVCQDPAIGGIQQVDIDIVFVLDACLNLIVVDPSSDKCGFSHLSVQEYLENRICSESQAHALAAKTCLNVLLAEAASRSQDDDIETAASGASGMQSIAIHDYANDNWHKHVQCHGDDDVDPHLVTLLKAFLGSMYASSTAYQLWQQRADYRFRVALKPNTCALLGICFFGFDTILSDWWGHDIDITRQLGRGSALSYSTNATSALVSAAKYTRAQMVRILIDAGADVNVKDNTFGCPLGAAAYEGNVEIVQILLNAGADVNAKGGEYGCPLGAAAYWGRLEIAQILLDAGAHVNVKGGSYGCPLGAAAFRGGHEVVQMLLDAGADVNVKGGSYGCPLGAAACWGRLETVQMLLDAGADVNVKGGSYGCPLGAAASKGNIEIVQILLNAGANVNAKDDEFGCPLGVAAYWGRLEIAHMLLNAGADVNAEGGEYGCPLGVAAYCGCLAMAEKLLESGADIHLRGGTLAQRQLRAAEANGGVFVRLQLETRAGDDDAADRHLNTALSAALGSTAGRYQVTLVRRLLKAWAGIPVRGEAPRMLGEEDEEEEEEEEGEEEEGEEDSDEDEEDMGKVVRRRRNSA